MTSESALSSAKISSGEASVKAAPVGRMMPSSGLMDMRGIVCPKMALPAKKLLDLVTEK